MVKVTNKADWLWADVGAGFQVTKVTCQCGNQNWNRLWRIRSPVSRCVCINLEIAQINIANKKIEN